MKFKAPPFIWVISLLFMTVALGASDGFEFRQGSIWIGNAYRSPWSESPVEGSEASPIISITGAGYTAGLTPQWQLSPGLDLWYKDFAFTGGRGVPTQIETAPSEEREVAGTLGLLFAVPVEYTYSISDTWFARGGFSPTTLYRLPVSPVEDSAVDQLATFFYEGGRFFYPELRIAFGYRMERRVSFQFAGRWLFPVFRLWDGGPDLPWWDSHMIAGQLGVLIRLPE
ncbi:MAG: hypothetical protein ACLFNQ_06870 [Spirochaetaceae bacterium]